MKQYKKVVIGKIIALSLFMLFMIGIGIFDAVWARKLLQNNAFVFSFQCGFSLALGILAMLQIIRFGGALKSEEKLRILYNKENDERIKFVKAKAGQPLLLILSVLLILVAMVIGYFHAILFYTLLIVASVQLIVSCIIKFVYLKIV